MHRLHFALELALGRRQRVVLAAEVVDLLTEVGGLVLGLLAGALHLVERDEHLLLLGLQQSATLLGSHVLLADVVALALLLLHLHLQLAHLLLVLLQVLLRVGVGLVRVVQGNLELL